MDGLVRPGNAGLGIGGASCEYDSVVSDSPPRRSTSCPTETTVYDYVTGRLPEQAVGELSVHLQECPDCQQLISWMRHAPPAEGLASTAVADRQPGDAADRTLRSHLTGRMLAGKYLLGRCLGSGGMGVVYEAVNVATDRRVAVKLLHPFFSSDAETISRFRHEAKSPNRIGHPSIVDVLDLGQDPVDGSVFMVQEFLSGDTLRRHLTANRRLSVAESAAIMLPIMDALAAAHAVGIVHRDVKPENIILSRDRSGRLAPKLIDFGISKIISGDKGT